MTQTAERRPIPGHRQYEIDENGVIFRIEGAERTKGKALKSGPQKMNGKETGYIYVSLITKDDADIHGNPISIMAPKRISVHRLVALTFHGPPPKGKPWVNHKNGIKHDNKAENLEWTSISENIQHKFDTGLQVMPKGKDHWLFGKTASGDTKKLMSEQKTGENHPKFKGWYVKNSIEHASAIIAAKATGETQKQVITRTAKKIKGWSFKPKPITINSTIVNGETTIFDNKETNELRGKFYQEYPITISECTPPSGEPDRP